MSTIYNTTLKSTRMTDVVAAIDSGGTGNPGYIEIATAGMGTILATIHFADVCAAVTSGVLTISGVPLTATAANSGTAAAAEVFDHAGTLIISGLTVGVSATDIVLSSVAIVSGQPVTLTAGSITHG